MTRVPWRAGSVLYLESAQSPSYRGALARRLLSCGLDLSDPELDLGHLRRVRSETLAETVLLGWESITLRGAPFPYSRENAALALQWSDALYQFVSRYSGGEQQAKQRLLTRLADVVDWQIRWGKSRSTLHEAWRRTGQIPPALLRQPEMTPDLEFYLDAYSFLSAFRQPGFSEAGPLAYDSLVRYAEVAGYTSADDIQFFSEALLVCDQAAREAFKATSASKTPSKPR